MSRKINQHTLHFKKIAELHQAIGISRPRHPLFSITRFEEFPALENNQRLRIISDFYQITLKTDCPCKIQYGQSIFDFDEGVVSCFAPKQVSIIDETFTFAKAGFQINIDPEFLRTYPLQSKIKDYHFFDYEINEALILSEDEEKTLENIFLEVEKEYHLPIDHYSHDVVIAQLELLLSYCNRYYNRQFANRKIRHSELLTKIEALTQTYLNDEAVRIPLSATWLASQVNFSPKYLSDCLKQLTGLTTQQFIHGKMIEVAKEKLSTTELSVNEIAWQLGFEYSQSFSKLFRTKTNQTPGEFRAGFN